MSTHSKPSILFLINSFGVGGAQRVFLDDSAALQQKGYTVHMATLYDAGPLAPAGTLTHMGVRQLRTLLREKNINILVTTLNEANALGRIAVLGLPVRLITREANVAEAKSFLYKFLDVLFGLRSETIIAVSHAVAHSITAYAPWLRSRVSVLYNGVRVLAQMPARPQIESEIRLLCVASLSRKKDQTILLQALTLLPPHVTLTFVGEGKERARLETFATSLRIRERVTFAGSLFNELLAATYLSHHVFVLPSQYEGCPNVISEAQSFAMPVVAFDIPGMREFVSRESGILATTRSPEALAEAIRNVLKPSVMQAMGEAGFREVSAMRSRDQHLQAFEALL